MLAKYAIVTENLKTGEIDILFACPRQKDCLEFIGKAAKRLIAATEARKGVVINGKKHKLAKVKVKAN
jgi:hypothetical protein